MNKRWSVTYFVCLMLVVSIIGSGCTKKGGATTEMIKENSNEVVAVAKEESTASDVEVTKKVPVSVEMSEVQSEVPVKEEANSPWTLVSESSVTTAVNYAGFLNESIGVTVGYAGAISYTADGGKTWSQSSNSSACRYGIDYYDESFIISSGNAGVNLLSNDQGKSWSYLGEFPLTSGAGYNKFLSVIDKENIYIGSPKSLGVTKDGGKNWQAITVPEACTRIVGMFFLTTEIGYLLNTDGTLFTTVDSCETWTAQTIDLSGEKIDKYSMPAVAINFQDEDHGMIVYASKTYKLFCSTTEDGGSTWETIEMPKTSGLAPYITRDGRFLTLSTATKKISLYQLEDK